MYIRLTGNILKMKINVYNILCFRHNNHKQPQRELPISSILVMFCLVISIPDVDF